MVCDILSFPNHCLVCRDGALVLPATESTSPEEFNAVLACLEYLLANLPEPHPNQVYQPVIKF